MIDSRDVWNVYVLKNSYHIEFLKHSHYSIWLFSTQYLDDSCSDAVKKKIKQACINDNSILAIISASCANAKPEFDYTVSRLGPSYFSYLIRIIHSHNNELKIMRRSKIHVQIKHYSKTALFNWIFVFIIIKIKLTKTDYKFKKQFNTCPEFQIFHKCFYWCICAQAVE